MNLDELMCNSFCLENYEKFLLEIFNIDLSRKDDLLYLIDKPYLTNISKLLYYGDYLDDNFNNIELYVIKLRNMENYKDLSEVVFNLLNLNQTNYAIVAVYSSFSDKWFLTFIYSEYMVENNKLVTYKTKINDYIHWYGFSSHDNVLKQIFNIKISVNTLKELLKVNTTSILIINIAELINKLEIEKSYEIVINVMYNMANNRKARSSLEKQIFKKITEYEKNTNEKVKESTIVELYNYINNQESVSINHIKTVCENTLIEYLSINTYLLRNDLIDYVKYAYDNKDLIKKHIDESIKNGGRTFINIKLPYTIIYNIDYIDNLLNNIKILDYSINSGITLAGITYLIAKLKYVNKIIQGYSDISIKKLYEHTISNNIYGITLNKQSIITTELLLNTTNDVDKNLVYADALNLYEEYDYINKSIKKTTNNNSKKEVLDDIVLEYNKTHMHSKINKNFEKNFIKKHGYIPLIWQLDFPEVFKNNHKFDIIISNVEHINLTGMKEKKRLLKNYKLFDNNLRYEYYFIEKALELIDDNGVISLIVSDEYKNSDNSSVRDLLSKYTVLNDKKEVLIYTNKLRG